MMSRTSARRIICVVLASGCALGGWLAIRSWRSHDPAQTFQNARTALRSGDMEGVRQAIDELQQTPAYALHGRYLQGCLLLRKGRLTEALEEFRQAVHQPELEIDTMVLAGQTLYQMGRAGDAHQAWKQALKLNPAQVNANRWLGVLYYNLGAMEDALTHLEAVSHLAPDDPRPDRLMGLIYKDFERYKEAVDRYQESLRRDANQHDRDQILIELAESQVRISDYTSALAILKNCMHSPKMQTLEAECHFGLSDREEATRLTVEALKTSFEELTLLRLYGRILLGRGDSNKAIEVLSHAASLHPMDYSIQYNLAQAFSHEGNQTLAQQHAQRAEQLKHQWREFTSLHTRAIGEPSNADIRYQLGRMAQQLGRGIRLVARCDTCQ